MRRPRPAHLTIELAFGLFGAASLALAFVFSVVGIPPLPRAPMLMLGVPSPLSGMTRSFVALASGDLSGSFAWHPLGPIVFLSCIGMTTIAAASWLRGRRFTVLDRALADRRLWMAATALALIAWFRQMAVLG